MSQIQTFIQGMGPGGPILTLTGDVGGPVGPDGFGNINILGEQDPNIGFAVVTGIPGSTLTVTPFISEIATNDGAFNEIFSLPLLVDQAAVIQALIIGNKDDFSVCAGGYITACARRMGAAAATGPASSALFNTDYIGAPAPSAIIIPSGNNMSVRVRGVAGDTYHWTAQLFYQFQSL